MLVPLSAIIIAMGVFPAPFLRRMEPTLSRLVEHVESRAGQAAVAAQISGNPALSGGR